ncbi:MAG: heparan-alpha-glucosaminide N-acetyltransferase domain-containing protein [Methyloceanibacter sp.]
MDQIATPSAAAPGNLAGGRGESERIVSIDVLRGLVMALMALDHTRDYFSAGGFNPRDLSEPALFLTRWITHFCAPTFVFLAGLSAFLYGSKRTTGELSRFLVTRGLWLILIDLTLIRFGWRFDFNLLQAVAGIIFVIGASMIALAALIWLPRWAIAGVALLMIGGHNLFDGVRAQQFGDAYWVWHLLHQRGMLRLGDGVSLYVLYPLIPWIGVMAAGYVLGPAMQRTPEARQRLLFALGGAITLGFVLLRASNLYGDPAPWTVQHGGLATVLSFLNCEKYPPSLLYLMMTLGPALILLASFEHARGALAGVLSVFGQVPFFFYVTHIYLVHALALLAGFAMSGAVGGMAPLGFGLPAIYLVWILVLVLLYPVCRWFAGLKQRRREWWWSYL